MLAPLPHTGDNQDRPVSTAAMPSHRAELVALLETVATGRAAIATCLAVEAVAGLRMGTARTTDTSVDRDARGSSLEDTKPTAHTFRVGLRSSNKCQLLPRSY